MFYRHIAGLSLLVLSRKVALLVSIFVEAKDIQISVLLEIGS